VHWFPRKKTVNTEFEYHASSGGETRLASTAMEKRSECGRFGRLLFLAPVVGTLLKAHTWQDDVSMDEDED
jgi:hypothetical protein